MPKKATIAKAREDKKEGKAPTTQASEFVREEMEKYQGKIRSTQKRPKSRKQAIAIGLAMARREGVELPPPKGATVARKKEGDQRRAKAKTEKPPKAKKEKKTASAKGDGK